MGGGSVTPPTKRQGRGRVAACARPGSGRLPAPIPTRAAAAAQRSPAPLVQQLQLHAVCPDHGTGGGPGAAHLQQRVMFAGREGGRLHTRPSRAASALWAAALGGAGRPLPHQHPDAAGAHVTRPGQYPALGMQQQRVSGAARHRTAGQGAESPHTDGA
ncbi:MAG: hypothetical protein WDW38_005146 [Sanguina aurantia]